MTRLATGPGSGHRRVAGIATLRPSRFRSGFGPLFASELVASVVGFGVTVRLARRLGPSGFADFEYAAAVAAWWLVVVRGGFDAIVAREAARRPRLVGPLTDVLLGLRLGAAAVAMAAVRRDRLASGGPRGRVVVTFGLMLIPSALAADVGMRASGRFVGLAIAQVARALGLLVGVAMLVSGRAIRPSRRRAWSSRRSARPWSCSGSTRPIMGSPVPGPGGEPGRRWPAGGRSRAPIGSCG